MFKPTLLVILISLFYSNLWSQIGLVFPKDNYVFNSNNVTFAWNPESSSSTYHLQVAIDPNFALPIVDINNLSTTYYASSNLSFNQQYFYRVKANNSTWSSIYSFKIIDFRAWSELEIWLDADSVIATTNNKVDNWIDLSTSNNNFSQVNANKRPTLLSNSPNLNGHNAIQFNPTLLNHFNGGDLSGLNEGEIFSFISINQQPSIIGLETGLWSFGTNAASSHYPWIDNHIYSSFGRTERFDIIPTNNSFDLTKFHIINIKTDINYKFKINNSSIFNSSNGMVSFNNNVLLGKSKSEYYLNGQISEIILFNSVLSDSLSDLTHEYLRYKYAPPVNLGQNIEKYGICETIIYAGKYFENYLWSDGSTADSLIINSSGTYFIEVVDVFGNISKDTVEIQIDEFQYPSVQQYCTNDSLTWNTNLGPNYTYLWSDFSAGDTLIIDSPQTVHVKVTDTNGCIFESDTLTFSEDLFASSATLGSDTTMCSGNKIGLINLGSSANNYIWNTGETTPQLEINTTGSYSLIVQNANGCEAKDTISVTITGDAPNIQMQIPNIACLNAPFNFSDLSTTTDGSTIIGWTWAFGDGDSAAVNMGNHAYTTSGMYDIDLIVETSSGCFNKLTQTIEVKENPMLTFASTNQCQFEEIIFNSGQISPQTINSWDWNFADPASGNDNIGNGPNTSHTYGDYGDFDVMLIGTDIFGCVDTLVQTITIAPAPIADFTFNEVCEGSIVNFQNTSSTIAPAIINGRLWNFGDGTSSTQNNPQKPFASYGTYNVELTVNSDNGCSNSIAQSVKIHATPQVQYSVEQACAGLETSFTDASFVPDGSVAQVSWKFNNQTPLNGFSITKNFANGGSYSLEQNVTSGFGCVNSNISSVTINPYLNAGFTYTPSAFITDYPIAFESTSTGANEYAWSFGNFATSQQADTSIVFEENQIGTNQLVQLKVSNEWNCVDSASIELPVLIQRTDLEISQLFSQESNGFLTIGVRLKNNGTTPITEVDLVLNTPNTGILKETWSGMLQADEEEIYIFAVSPSAQISEESNAQNFMCVVGTITQPSIFIESDLSNNEVCKTMTENQPVVVKPYPNPVKDQLTIKVVMPKKGTLALHVFDNLGKLVHVITENQELEKGLNTFVLETSGWANGNYKIQTLVDSEGLGEIEVVGFVKI